jgi:hypothetical protein
MKKRKPELTAKAISSIANALQSANQMLADLKAISTALSTEGNGTFAEELAFDTLMGVWMDFTKVANAITNLHVATKYLHISTK